MLRDMVHDMVRAWVDTAFNAMDWLGDRAMDLAARLDRWGL